MPIYSPKVFFYRGQAAFRLQGLNRVYIKGLKPLAGDLADQVARAPERHLSLKTADFTQFPRVRVVFDSLGVKTLNLNGFLSQEEILDGLRVAFGISLARNYTAHGKTMIERKPEIINIYSYSLDTILDAFQQTGARNREFFENSIAQLQEHLSSLQAEKEALAAKTAELQTVLENLQRNSLTIEQVAALMGKIVHEINNILTGISGFASLASRAVSLEDVQESLKTSTQQTELLTRFVAALPSSVRNGVFLFDLLVGFDSPDYLTLRALLEAAKKGPIVPPVTFLLKKEPRTPLERISRVFLLDNEPDLLSANAKALKEAGCDVKTAAEAEAAVTEGSSGEHDLLVLDLELGGPMDGFGVLKNIREIWQTRGIAPVPAILCTSRYGEQVVREDAWKHDFAALVQKNLGGLNLPQFLEELRRQWNQPA